MSGRFRGGQAKVRQPAMMKTMRRNLQSKDRFMAKDQDCTAVSPAFSVISEIVDLRISNLESADRMETDLSLTEMTVPIMPLDVRTLSPGFTFLSNASSCLARVRCGRMMIKYM